MTGNFSFSPFFTGRGPGEGRTSDQLLTRGRAPSPAAKKKRGRTFSAEQRAAQAERMKAMWAKRKKGAKKKAAN